jgi:hypothetical protein
MRVERTVVSKEISEFMIDLKSLRNLMSDISLLLIEEGFGLGGGRFLVTLVYERGLLEFSVAGC